LRLRSVYAGIGIKNIQAVGVLATDAAAAGRIASSSTTPAVISANNKGKWRVYPNPFASGTVVDFTLPGAGRYSVVLYDSKGRRIKMLRQGWAAAGVRNLVSIDGSHLAGGLYYIRVYAGGKIQTLKLLKR
jgi:hypothetical protein